jgi:phage shock protein A
MQNTNHLMGLIGRISNVLRQKTNALIDAAQDPARQVEHLIEECKEHMKSATQELIDYKATEKRLAQKVAELTAQEATWQERAQAAVRAGDDALAREALLEAHRVGDDRTRVELERREMGGYAAELLRGRRELVQRLTELEMRKGTLTQQLAAGKPGGSSALAAEGRAWDAMDRAEARIGEAAALAEVDAMLGDPLAEGDALVEARLRESMKRAQADDALAELKKKMAPK